jgi:hypothetical protein
MQQEHEIDGYQFDRDFCQQCEHGCEESRVTFRMIKDESTLFLTLYNAHNGYYGHGFEMTCGNESLHDGTL